MTNFLTQFALHQGTQWAKRCFSLKVSIQSRAQAEPCHRVPTIGIRHRCACRLRVQPTIQVSSEGTKAWRLISWNGVTRGAMPVPARKPEWPLLAEAARAAAIAERERLTGSDGLGSARFLHHRKFSHRKFQVRLPGRRPSARWQVRVGKCTSASARFKRARTSQSRCLRRCRF
jgi:hypothetical protein